MICLSGCTPQVIIREYYWKPNNRPIEIEIKKEYTLNQGHSYDVEYTEDGMDITFHFKKQETIQREYRNGEWVEIS